MRTPAAFTIGLALTVLAATAQEGAPESAQTASASSPAPSPRYRLQESDPPIGTRIKETRASFNFFPLDRPYSRFTPEQKANLRGLYEDMPEDDEPPFPMAGLGPIIRDISRYAGTLRVKGEVYIHVTVNAQGKATHFDLMKYPDIDLARAVAYAFSQAKFKPAVCSGQPCQMQFPFRAVID